MNESKTPDWLIETQNKSWEPEILISGITLTFLFILSNHIYNFYGMLIQDFAVFDVMSKVLYIISVIILTGLKIILVIHLILRGVWTGFVGLSYVFPDGVKKENLPESTKNINYDKPETFVIKIEKICSLLFSFVFSSITFVIGFFIIYIPLIILFIIDLNMSYIEIIALIYSFVFIAGAIIFSILLATKLKNSRLKQKIENSIFNNILYTYFTNIGKTKSYLIFGSYFLIVTSLSFSDFSKFDFENDKSRDISSTVNINNLNRDHYEALRNQKLRIPKATIDQFHVTGHTIELFISYYKEDLYPIKELQKNSTFCKKFNIESDSTRIKLSDLYKIVIDDKPISGLRWYFTENKYTNQKGIITILPVENLTSGDHELKINKNYWSIKKKEMKLIKNWEIIPFEIRQQN